MMDEKTTGRRHQFSLLNLLLLTAVAALSLTVVTLWREVTPLRHEVRRLRAEVGELEVRDESRPHAIQLETDSDTNWKWLVWIPDGTNYVLHLANEKIPRSGVPSTDRHCMVIVGSGEQLILQYRIRRDPVDDRLTGFLSAANQIMLHTDGLEWIDWGRRIVEHRGVVRSSQQGPNDEPFVLLRYRNSLQAASIPFIEDPSPGVMVWLEPK